jgi:hypothetical protein
MTAKSSTRQKALRERRKAEGLKTLSRYVHQEWIPLIDAYIEKLKENNMANINSRKSIESLYTEEDHANYLNKQDKGPLTACVEILKTADENGDYRIRHGFFPEKSNNDSSLRLPIQDRYDSMLDWIEDAAKTGEL